MASWSIRAVAVAMVVAGAVALASCGSNQTNITQAVSKANQALASQDLELQCPDTVDTTSQFDCTFKGTKSGQTATVKMQLTGNNHDTLDAVDQNQANQAKVEASGQGGGSSTGGGSTTGGGGTTT